MIQVTIKPTRCNTFRVFATDLHNGLNKKLFERNTIEEALERLGDFVSTIDISRSTVATRLMPDKSGNTISKGIFDEEL
jgi:hypothetical protein